MNKGTSEIINHKNLKVQIESLSIGDFLSHYIIDKDTGKVSVNYLYYHQAQISQYVEDLNVVEFLRKQKIRNSRPRTTRSFVRLLENYIMMIFITQDGKLLDIDKLKYCFLENTHDVNPPFQLYMINGYMFLSKEEDSVEKLINRVRTNIKLKGVSQSTFFPKNIKNIFIPFNWDGDNKSFWPIDFESKKINLKILKEKNKDKNLRDLIGDIDLLLRDDYYDPFLKNNDLKPLKNGVTDYGKLVDLLIKVQRPRYKIRVNAKGANDKIHYNLTSQLWYNLLDFKVLIIEHLRKKGKLNEFIVLAKDALKSKVFIERHKSDAKFYNYTIAQILLSYENKSDSDYNDSYDHLSKALEDDSIDHINWLIYYYKGICIQKMKNVIKTIRYGDALNDFHQSIKLFEKLSNKEKLNIASPKLISDLYLKRALFKFYFEDTEKIKASFFKKIHLEYFGSISDLKKSISYSKNISSYFLLSLISFLIGKEKNFLKYIEIIDEDFGLNGASKVILDSFDQGYDKNTFFQEFEMGAFKDSPIMGGFESFQF